ncbi:PREDICTED: cytosol aminopeptidase-like [Nicrophorus vespilloides]|uniref:Cytosol aminopeptidase n=1 Tax=Nicrophorus vespilloides TaxID=110193 RepID=A0ABM1MW88_NICVS|nr:PREDICTED: cytosol aminopeptidase-like [Nicrophorus vespilloides]
MFALRNHRGLVRRVSHLLEAINKNNTTTKRRYCAPDCSLECEKKGIILGVYQGDQDQPILSPAAARYNDKVDGKILELVKSTGPLAEGMGRAFNNVDNEFWAVAVVGLGPENRGYNELEAIDEGMEAVRKAAAKGAVLLKFQGCTRVLVEGFGFPEQAAEGTALALWQYQENKMKENWKVIPTIELHDDGDMESFQRGLFKAESQNLARRLSDTPANLMTPLHFAQECVNELCPCGIKVEVHDRDWIEHTKMNAFMAVARGSCEPPILLTMSYCGGPQDLKPILIVGKGITFDSGGICIKKKFGMARYRGDLTGAASIVGAIRSVSALSLPININVVIPLCENMPSGMAMKCGDVVMGMNGKSIMITDTDNEGRLCLADAIIYGMKTYKPRLVIDIASLTPGIGSALGGGPSGVYCNSQTMWSQVRKAGIITGDRVWRMPLWKFYTKKVTDFPSHDVDNKGKGKGDSCLAAAFLQEFIHCVDWIHFDTTGVGMLAEDKVVPYYTKGRMTGRPTRTLTQLLYQLSCPAEGARELK